jgi:nucleoporin NUP82
MRLSPALLDIMSSSHRTVSAQTADLETAASELFRRCERLREELLEQVKQMSELADKLHKIQDPKDDDLRPGEEQLTQDRRLERAREKQLQLNKRFDELRRKVGKVGSSKKELSTKEVAWVDEIALIGNKVGVNAAEEELVKESIEARMHTVSAVQRTVPFFLILTNQVKELSQQLVAEAKRLQETQKQQETEDLTSSRTSMASSSGSRRASGFLVSSRYQKERIAEVMSMVEREGAVIDAVTRRLDALKVDNVM